MTEKKLCYTAVMGESGFTAGIVVDGEKGYNKTNVQINPASMPMQIGKAN